MRLSQSCNVTAISSPINGLYKSKRTLSPPCGGATALRVAVEGFFSIPLKIPTLVCPVCGYPHDTTSRPLAAGKDDSDEKQEPIDVCFDRRAGGPVDNPGRLRRPAKEAASSRGAGQAASSAASQTEETAARRKASRPRRAPASSRRRRPDRPPRARRPHRMRPPAPRAAPPPPAGTGAAAGSLRLPLFLHDGGLPARDQPEPHPVPRRQTLRHHLDGENHPFHRRPHQAAG